MGLTFGLVLSGVLIFAAASFFFAVAESALFALGKWRAKQLAERESVRGAEVLALLQRAPELLSTLVLGNTIANASIIALALWPALLGHSSLAWTLLAAQVLILVGCEVFPKTLGVRSPERWALRVVTPMRLLCRWTAGIQALVQRCNNALLRWTIPISVKPQSALTDEEYQELLEMAYQQGTLAASEKEIILQIINLDRKTVKDVMKPRSTMAAISDDLSLEEMMSEARRHRHRRLPIYDESPDTIVGVLNTTALLLNPDMDLADAVEFPSFVPESMNLLQLLKSLARQKRGLAIVLDEFGGTAGLVTSEDILEEVVGEIRHEDHQEGFEMKRMEVGKWRVSGTMRLDDFRREYPALGRHPDVNTFNGLMMTELGVVPSQGEWIVFHGLRLTAMAVEERRVREVLVEVTKKAGGRHGR